MNRFQKMTKIILGVVVTLALLAFVSGGPVPEEFKDVQEDMRRVCLEESGAEEDVVIEGAKGNFTGDPKFKCYMKCVFDQFRLLNKKGLNFHALLALSPSRFKDDTIAMIAACRNETGTDLCDLSYNISKCFFKTRPNTYFVL